MIAVLSALALGASELLGDVVPFAGADPLTWLVALFAASVLAGLFLRTFLDSPAYSGGPEDDPFLDQ